MHCFEQRQKKAFEYYTVVETSATMCTNETEVLYAVCFGVMRECP